MNQVIALVGLLAGVALVIRLIRDLASDGYGTRPSPRSHVEELGSWVSQQLAR